MSRREQAGLCRHVLETLVPCRDLVYRACASKTRPRRCASLSMIGLSFDLRNIC